MTHLTGIRFADFAIEEFMTMKPAPGHRDSEGRAARATHLHKLIPEHLQVEVAEYTNREGGKEQRSMTGNTRRQVWSCRLSDKVPETVRATIYEMSDETEVRERMLYHDSREAAWTSKDYMYRARNMTPGLEDWKPGSKALKGGTWQGAVQDAYSIHNLDRWSVDKSVKVELILKEWTNELMDLDQILNTSLAPVIKEARPFTRGFFSASLLLLRYRPYDVVETFLRAVLNDEGTKTDEGLDGVNLAADNLRRKGTKDEIFAGMIGSFKVWEEGRRQVNSAVRRMNVMAWAKDQKNKKRDAEKQAATLRPTGT